MERYKLKINIFKDIITVLILVMFALFFYKHRQEVRIFLTLNIFSLAILFLFVWLGVYLKATALFVFYNFFNLNLNFKEVVKISILSRYYNHLFSKGGLIYKGILFKKSLGQSIKKSFFVFSLNSFLDLYTAALIVFIFFLWGFLFGKISVISFFTFFLLFIFLNIPLFLPARALKQWGKKNKYLTRVFLNFFKIKNKKITNKYILLNMIVLVIAGWRLWFCFFSLGLSINIYAAVFLIAVGNFSLLLNLTPAGIGIREGFVYAGAFLFGLNPQDALLAAVLDRVINSVFILIYGFFLEKKFSPVKTFK